MAVFAVLFAAADMRELVHQIDESRTGVAIIAAVLIAVHLLVAGAALIAIGRKSGPSAIGETA